MGVIKRIFGGKRGYSGGNDNRTLKNPPSLQVISERVKRGGLTETYYSVSGGLWRGRSIRSKGAN